MSRSVAGRRPDPPPHRSWSTTVVTAAASLVAIAVVVTLGLQDPTRPSASASSRAPTAPETETLGPWPLLGPLESDLGRALDVSAPEPAIVAPTGPTPAGLRVPVLGIDAGVVAVGVDDDGAFDVPEPQLVGWYAHGPRPGEQGSTVLAAHVDLANEPGVFVSLSTVVPGDRVFVDFDDGTSAEFVVTEDLLYDKTTLPASDLFRRAGEPVLRLITCGGTYDPATRHYRGNRVVTAVPV